MRASGLPLNWRVQAGQEIADKTGYRTLAALMEEVRSPSYLHHGPAACTIDSRGTAAPPPRRRRPPCRTTGSTDIG